jgi:hypothetical protein
MPILWQLPLPTLEIDPMVVDNTHCSKGSHGDRRKTRLRIPTVAKDPMADVVVENTHGSKGSHSNRGKTKFFRISTVVKDPLAIVKRRGC